MTPNPVPQERLDRYVRPRAKRANYDWSGIEYGVWQNWVDLPDGTDRTTAKLACNRFHVAALRYARANGLTCESHRSNNGRTLDMRFDVPAA